MSFTGILSLWENYKYYIYIILKYSDNDEKLVKLYGVLCLETALDNSVRILKISIYTNSLYCIFSYFNKKEYIKLYIFISFISWLIVSYCLYFYTM